MLLASSSPECYDRVLLALTELHASADKVSRVRMCAALVKNDRTPRKVRELWMKNFVLRFINDTDGQDLIEYALLAALIALAAITAMTNLGGAINSKFDSVSTQLGS